MVGSEEGQTRVWTQVPNLQAWGLPTTSRHLSAFSLPGEMADAQGLRRAELCCLQRVRRNAQSTDSLGIQTFKD